MADTTARAVLTPRAREVVMLAAIGFGQRETAAVLGLSVFTVRHYRRRAYEALGVAGWGDPITAAAVALWRAERGGRWRR